MEGWLDLDKLATTFNKVKNAVLNLPEYQEQLTTSLQVKVLEATGPEHWGASSTLMLDIATATSNPTHFADIFRTIYDRIQEPPSSSWRQNYKALQLLEYLIKNGNERSVDYAKDRIYELKALRNFHYTDEKGKDQGINVRNRATEIVSLLGDDQRIKEERKKARENRNKYTGVSSSGKYGGFAGGMSASTYSSGGGYAGSSSGGDNSGGGYGGFRDEDESYLKNSYTSGNTSASVNGVASSSRQHGSRNETSSRAPPKVVFKSDDNNPKKPTTFSQLTASTQLSTPTIDLLGMDFPSTSNAASNSNDDWGDFASATTVQQVSSTSANKTAFANFASFQSNPLPQSQSTLDDFGDFTSASSTNTTSVAAIPAFADFVSSTPQGNYTLQSLNSQFASFGVAPTTPAPTPTVGLILPNRNQTQPLSTTSITPFQFDAFSNLVSLDASALSGAGKRASAAGPSLSVLGTSQFGQFGTTATAMTAQQPHSQQFVAVSNGFVSSGSQWQQKGVGMTPLTPINANSSGAPSGVSANKQIIHEFESLI
ncbi:Epsin-3, clathrin recruitment and traffic between the Golgi and endosome [Physocladia obscura]|uniref:Epsin-3, clathrin recruitment and traffic between the Golgi and endosome n=1 Tax=Physocladia obscura TaxID=109957 RepID=A0AAD5SUH5_9FUNG|nr:Epsin-3, clathrin recruitment and traffic between the Golgi and endosome [Physocladia obscura]